jgi:hypothetical protein
MIRSKAPVKRHHSSLECKDTIKFMHTLIHQIYVPCPWRQQYELLFTHIRYIIGPCPPPPQHVKHINQLTKIRNASDGSVLYCQGFQGWLIAKLDNEVLVQGFGATYGRVDDVSSYRAEICGNIATFTVFTLIRKVYGFAPPSIEHVCKNQSAISATWKDENINIFNKSKPDADVAKLSRNAIADLELHFLVTAYWVEGHTLTD